MKWFGNPHIAGELVSIAEIIPDPRELREDRVRSLLPDMEENGQQWPIELDGFKVKNGNTRLEAAKRLGFTHIYANRE